MAIPDLLAPIRQLFGIGGHSPPSQELDNAGYQQTTPENDQDRAAQLALLQQLKGAAAGTGPSAAQSQLSDALSQTIQAQSAAAAGGRYGQNVALRQRAVANQGADLASRAANAAAGLRSQEAVQARAQEGGMADQVRAGDLGIMGQRNAAVTGLEGAQEAQRSAFGQQMLGGMISMASGGLGQSLMSGGGGGGGMGGAMGGMGGIGGGGAMDAGGAAGMDAGSAAGMGSAADMGMMMAARGALVDRPTRTVLGERGPEVVIPLAKGSAPYRPGAIPTKPGKRPSKAIPKSARIDPVAAARIAGTAPPAKAPGAGAAPLSPEVYGKLMVALASRPRLRDALLRSVR